MIDETRASCETRYHIIWDILSRVLPMQQRERELEIERRNQEEKNARMTGGQGDKWKAGGPAQAHRVSQPSGDNWNSKKTFKRENGGQGLNGPEVQQEASKMEDTPNERYADVINPTLSLALIITISLPPYIFGL